MSNFSTDCVSRITSQITMTVMSEIAICQSAAVANTSYCYPPNGTRICVPSTNIPFYWAPYFYNTPQISVSTSLNHAAPFTSNTGNRTLNFTSSIYDNDATAIPGVQNEKAIKIYFQGSGDDKTKHEGPTLILVKTEDWPENSSDDDDSDDDDDDNDNDHKKKVSPGVIAGSVIGGVVAIVALALLCCWRGCCGRKGRKRGEVVGDKELGQDSEGMVQPRVEGERGGVVAGEEKMVMGPPPVYKP